MKKTTEDIFNEMKENFLGMLQTRKSYALISAYYDGITEEEIRKKRSGLKWSIRHLKLHGVQFFSRWNEIDKETNNTVSIREFGSIAYDIPLKAAMELGREYNQLSIVFKSGDECNEICTIPFTDLEGNRYNEGDVVRTFNIKSPDIAREIFGKRAGCPGRKSNDEKHSCTLDSVYRVVDPKPTVFSSDERLFPIL